jgi:integrase
MLRLIGANEPSTLHDLRRTATTGMADLGVQPHIIEEVWNHVSGHNVFDGEQPISAGLTVF